MNVQFRPGEAPYADELLSILIKVAELQLQVSSLAQRAMHRERDEGAVEDRRAQEWAAGLKPAPQREPPYDVVVRQALMAYNRAISAYEDEFGPQAAYDDLPSITGLRWSESAPDHASALSKMTAEIRFAIIDNPFRRGRLSAPPPPPEVPDDYIDAEEANPVLEALVRYCDVFGRDAMLQDRSALTSVPEYSSLATIPMDRRDEIARRVHDAILNNTFGREILPISDDLKSDAARRLSEGQAPGDIAALMRLPKAAIEGPRDACPEYLPTSRVNGVAVQVGDGSPESAVLDAGTGMPAQGDQVGAVTEGENGIGSPAPSVPDQPTEDLPPGVRRIGRYYRVVIYKGSAKGRKLPGRWETVEEAVAARDAEIARVEEEAEAAALQMERADRLERELKDAARLLKRQVGEEEDHRGPVGCAQPAPPPKPLPMPAPSSSLYVPEDLTDRDRLGLEHSEHGMAFYENFAVGPGGKITVRFQTAKTLAFLDGTGKLHGASQIAQRCGWPEVKRLHDHFATLKPRLAEIGIDLVCVGRENYRVRLMGAA
jgi:hypothetical protein